MSGQDQHNNNDRMRIRQKGGKVERLSIFRSYLLCYYYNVKEVEQLVFLSEFRSNFSYIL